MNKYLGSFGGQPPKPQTGLNSSEIFQETQRLTAEKYNIIKPTSVVVGELVKPDEEEVEEEKTGFNKFYSFSVLAIVLLISIATQWQ